MTGDKIMENTKQRKEHKAHQINIKCGRTERAEWARQASSEGENLSFWIREKLNESIGKLNERLQKLD